MTTLKIEIDLEVGSYTTPDVLGALEVARMLASIGNELIADKTGGNPHAATGPVRDLDGVQVGVYWVDGGG